MTPEEKQALEIKVKEVLEQIRPYLQSDGGDLKFVNMTDDKVVYVELQGHCGTCPHAMMTLKQGVEQAVIEALPEIKSVERV
ncbi:MAG: NifU family protein [Bacteroidales bacterium]|nr:NifU family protein [Bacteroidales bacterium]MDD4685360.1 NifU family protein [Bacteroidales bacterium]